MVLVRKIPKNEGSKGIGTLGTHPETIQKELQGKPTRRGPGRPRGPSRAKKKGKVLARKRKSGAPIEEKDIRHLERDLSKDVEEALTAQVLTGNHPLSFSVLERFQMRSMVEEGYSKVDIAQRFSTSIPVVSQILRMKEKLSKAREDQLTGHFFQFSKLLEEIVGGMDSGKIDRASFSQLSLAMGITFDKMLAVRKALDGDAPERHQHELAIGSFQDRADLKERVKSQLERIRDSGKLSDLIPVEAQVIKSGSVGTLTEPEGSSPTDPDQIELFQSKEPE